MPVNGFKFHEQTPTTSDQMVEKQKRYYLECIESFEPSRCMFESNFPVDNNLFPIMSYGIFLRKSQKILVKMKKTVCFTIALKSLLNLMFTD